MRLDRPSPALAVAVLALFVALGGTSAVAVPAVKRLTDGDQVRRASLPGDRLRPRSLPAGRVRADALGGGQVAERTLAAVPLTARADDAARAATSRRAQRSAVAERAGRATAAGRAAVAGRAATVAQVAHVPVAERLAVYRPGDVVRVAPTAVTAPGDLSAAPEVVLAADGPFTVYGRCAATRGDPATLTAAVLVRADRGGTALSGRAERAVDLAPGAAPEARRSLALARSGPALPLATALARFSLLAPTGAVTEGSAWALARPGGGPPAGPLGSDGGCLFSVLVRPAG